MNGLGIAWQANCRGFGISGRVVGCGLIVENGLCRGQMLTGVIGRRCGCPGFEFAILPLKPHLGEKQFQTPFARECS